MTGSMPGIAASTNETWLLGSPPNSVAAPENSFEFEVTWAWTSSPITISQSPVAPLTSFAFVALMLFHSRAARRRWLHIRFRSSRSQPVFAPGGTNSRRCRDRLRPGPHVRAPLPPPPFLLPGHPRPPPPHSPLHAPPAPP